MAEPRTEAEAEAGDLTITLGGRSYRLPALTIRQGKEWRASLAGALSGMEADIPEDAPDGGEGALRSILSQGPAAKVAALAAYDIGGVLGGLDAIEARMTQRELGAAIEVVMEAEYPFEPDERRSVVEAFGLPLRVLGLASRAVTEGMSRPASSPSGPSRIGASNGPASSAPGPLSSSSSDGPTASGGPAGRSRTARSRRR